MEDTDLDWLEPSTEQLVLVWAQTKDYVLRYRIEDQLNKKLMAGANIDFGAIFGSSL